MESKRGSPNSQLSVPFVLDFVRDVEYPAWKEDFIISAEDSRAPVEILNLLETLPDEEYKTQMYLEDTLAELLENEG